MDRADLLERVKALKEGGKSIRAIAAELGVHPSRVQRALNSLTRRPTKEARPTSSSAPFSGLITGGLFVGRRVEMGILEAALEDARRGRGRLVMLTGELGIGKTRIAQELANYAVERGARVLWGNCYEGQGAPPYWPWVQPMRSYLQQREMEDLLAELGPGASDIAEIIPEMRELFPDLEPPPALEAEQARFQLFDSVTTFLRRVARTKPLVLILEDLHWADKPSLLLLEFVIQELAETPLLVVGTYRDVELNSTHPLFHSLGELARHQCFHQMLLQGLPSQDVKRFVTAVAGVEPPPELVKTVYLKTEGNPLFVTEVVRLLVQQGALSAEYMGEKREWSIEIPQNVHTVIRRRLSRLSEGCNHVLTVAAVIGREFDFKLLNNLTDSKSDNLLLELLEEALDAHVIEELAGETEGYQFSHILVQQTLYEGLSAGRKVRLHAQIVEALETLYSGSLAAHATELVYHCAKARPILGVERLVRYSLMAGERALSAYAYEEALAYFQRALDAKKGQGMDREMAGLLFGLGRAQGATGQSRDAWSTLTTAFNYWMESGDVAMAVAVAEYPLLFVSGLPQVTDMVTRALTLVPSDSIEAGRLLSRYGLLLNLETGDYERARGAFSHALTIAQREKDVALEMQTLAAAADADHYQLRWREVLEKSVRCIELAQYTGAPQGELWPHYLASCTLISATGDPEGASRHATTMLELAEQLRNRSFLITALAINAMVAHTRGDWKAAHDFYERGLALAPRMYVFSAYRALLEYELGNFTQGDVFLERLIEVMHGTVPGPTGEFATAALVPPLAARITGAVNRLDIARPAADTVLSSPSATPMFAIIARAALGLIAIQQSDRAVAREQYAALVSQRDTMLPGGIVAVGRVLGLLSLSLGQPNQAMSHFEDALTLCQKGGYQFELAWTCRDYAAALLRRSRPGDRDKAMSLLNKSLTISRELGMEPLKKQVTSLQDRAGSQAAKGPAYPNGLTEREVEVLRLIARGKSNREIAEELIISLSTVAHHVSNIINKTGVANRAEAATYAARHGLVS